MFVLRESLVLGSASPRRRELLARFGLEFEVLVPDVDESAGSSERPEEYLERIVGAKLARVEVLNASRPVALVVADTIVVFEGRILGKPASEREARGMLEGLVGASHRVLTRYAVRSAQGDAVARTCAAEVTFRSASPSEIDGYVATTEGADKAGGYAMQGLGSYFVDRIEGDPTTVIGLPVGDVLRTFVELGIAELRG